MWPDLFNNLEEIDYISRCSKAVNICLHGSGYSRPDLYRGNFNIFGKLSFHNSCLMYVHEDCILSLDGVKCNYTAMLEENNEKLTYPVLP